MWKRNRILSFIIYSNIFFNYILGYINDEEILEKQLIPFKEEILKGEFMGKEDDEDNSAGNWEAYRIEILNKRKTPRKISDIINILKTIWELLNNALNNKNIINIHCFMNIIFTPLNNLIKNSKEMKTTEDRREFEKEFDKIVNNYITDYTILSKSI